MSDYLKSLLNAFHDLLFIFTTDGIIEDYLTPNHEEDLILPRDAFLGKHHREVLPPHVSKNIERAFKKIDGGEEQFKFDYSLEMNGDTHWYVAVFSKFEHGDKPGYLGAVRNITSRKNQELLLRGILNTSPGGIMVFEAERDSEGTIIDFKVTHINRAVEKLTDTTEEQLIGQSLGVLVPDSAEERVLARFRTVVETGQPVNFEYHHVDESDETVWYLCRAAKFKDGIVSSFLDITDQYKVKEELVKTNEKLKELNRQKDKLFSVIAHDLKNAVSGPMGVYDLIFEEQETLSREELFEYLELLNKGARSANELLEDLLLWSKNQFDDMTLNPEKVRLREITIALLNNISLNTDEKGIDINNRVPEDIYVHADPVVVKSILRNLITNGIKFSHPGFRIIIRAERTNGEVEISVTDEGVGIEKKALEKIFDKTNNYTTRGTKGEKGSGIGLDLCIDFVEKHGGKIWAESEPGKGSTFTFTLPADTK